MSSDKTNKNPGFVTSPSRAFPVLVQSACFAGVACQGQRFCNKLDFLFLTRDRVLNNTRTFARDNPMQRVLSDSRIQGEISTGAPVYPGPGSLVSSSYATQSAKMESCKVDKGVS